MPPRLDHERALWDAGHRYVAGVDEVGRGCLAGPVVAGVVILSADPSLGLWLRASGLRDSKQLDGPTRSRLAPLVAEAALARAVGEASAAEIDEVGIVQAVRFAIGRALAQLPVSPDAFLLDGGLKLPDDARPQQTLVKGDDRALSIAAAALLAKLYRDDLMVRLDAEYPGYGWASNKGYGAPQHLAAIAARGPTPHHRMSWAPLRQPTLFGWDDGAA